MQYNQLLAIIPRWPSAHVHSTSDFQTMVISHAADYLCFANNGISRSADNLCLPNNGISHAAVISVRQTMVFRTLRIISVCQTIRIPHAADYLVCQTMVFRTLRIISVRQTMVFRTLRIISVSRNNSIPHAADYLCFLNNGIPRTADRICLKIPPECATYLTEGRAEKKESPAVRTVPNNRRNKRSTLPKPQAGDASAVRSSTERMLLSSLSTCG